MAREQVGTILGVSGSWGSGLAMIRLKVGRKTVTLYADNGPLFRALNDAFGGIMPGHQFDVSAVIGRKIRFSTDEMMGDMLAGFDVADNPRKKGKKKPIIIRPPDYAPNRRPRRKIRGACPHCGRIEAGVWWTPCPSDDCPSHDKRRRRPRRNPLTKSEAAHLLRKQKSALRSGARRASFGHRDTAQFLRGWAGGAGYAVRTFGPKKALFAEARMGGLRRRLEGELAFQRNPRIKRGIYYGPVAPGRWFVEAVVGKRRLAVTGARTEARAVWAAKAMKRSYPELPIIKATGGTLERARGFAPMRNPGIIFSGKDAVSIYRLLAIKHALRLEVLGLKHSRGSVYAMVKREFGLRGDKKSVSDQFSVLSERLIAEAQERMRKGTGGIREIGPNAPDDLKVRIVKTHGEVCSCGHLRALHADAAGGYAIGHGHCEKCACPKYTWTPKKAAFLNQGYNHYLVYKYHYLGMPTPRWDAKVWPTGMRQSQAMDLLPATVIGKVQVVESRNKQQAIAIGKSAAGV